MSYCRFIEGDVYAYETDGGVQFWVSSDNKALDCLCNTFSEAYQYAKELRDVHGLDVPSYAIEALKEDALEEAKRISGDSGVIGELQAEDAKLRKKLEMLQDGYGSMSREHSQTIAELSDAHFEIDRLKSENAKLRELVWDMWREGAFEAGACYEKAAQRLEERTRELGIEVDE